MRFSACRDDTVMPPPSLACCARRHSSFRGCGPRSRSQSALLPGRRRPGPVTGPARWGRLAESVRRAQTPRPGRDGDDGGGK